MCCSSYDYLSSKTSGNLLGRGLVNIAVPAGGEGGQLPSKFPRFGQNSNFSGKIKIQIGQNTFFFKDHHDFRTKFLLRPRISDNFFVLFINYYKIMIWTNVTRFGQNFIAPTKFFGLVRLCW